MRVQRRHLWIGGGILLAAGAVYLALRPTVVTVDVAAVTRGPLQVTVGDEGRTRARQRHLITAPVAGRLDPVTLQVGDSVAPGTAVAWVAPLPLDARSRTQAVAALGAAEDLSRIAEANRLVARSALRQAQLDHRRGQELYAAGAIALSELERLDLIVRARERDLEVAGAEAAAAAHDVSAARGALLASGSADNGANRLALSCPIGGRVFEIPSRSGRTVQAGELLLTVGDPTDLEVVVDVLSSEAVSVRPGQRMLVTGWGGEEALGGTIAQVEPAGFTKVSALGVEEQRVNIIGRLDSVPAGLGDGFRLEVRVVTWEGDSVLALPSSALFRQGEQWMVFVVEDGRARAREVAVGHAGSQVTEVVEGVAQGQLVIRHPNDLIRDGTRVAVAPPP